MKNWKFIILTFLLVITSYHSLRAEDITLTAYYPAPYGKYKQLEVVEVAGSGGTLTVENRFTVDTSMLDVNPSANSISMNTTDITLTATNGVTINNDLDISNDATVGNDLIVTNSITCASQLMTVPDIAEYIHADGCQGADVVIIDPNNDDSVVKSNLPYDARVAGVISEHPVFKIGNPDAGKPLAIAGRVYCNATIEGGSIKRGDILVTSSKPGYAMKADIEKIKYGMSIGKALSELREGEGKVLVLININ